MKIYLVENCENAPGRILAIFASEEDANKFADALDEECDVVERTLFYGQPDFRGYNE